LEWGFQKNRNFPMVLLIIWEVRIPLGLSKEEIGNGLQKFCRAVPGLHGSGEAVWGVVVRGCLPTAVPCDDFTFALDTAGILQVWQEDLRKKKFSL
jgi:hypothetical protein